MCWTMPCWKRLTGLSCRNVVMGHVPARTLWTVPFCGDPLPNVTIHEHPGTIVPRFGSIQVVSPILECVHTHHDWSHSHTHIFGIVALHAVQDLSFGSTLVRHMDAIDDVLIANNIANSANGEKTESYNFWWSWEDAAGEIQKNLERQRSADSTSLFSVASRYRTNQGNHGYGYGQHVWGEALGLTCGRLCDVMDTTTTTTTTTTTSHPTH